MFGSGAGLFGSPAPTPGAPAAGASFNFSPAPSPTPASGFTFSRPTPATTNPPTGFSFGTPSSASAPSFSLAVPSPISSGTPTPGTLLTGATTPGAATPGASGTTALGMTAPGTSTPASGPSPAAGLSFVSGSFSTAASPSSALATGPQTSQASASASVPATSAGASASTGFSFSLPATSSSSSAQQQQASAAGSQAGETSQAAGSASVLEGSSQQGQARPPKQPLPPIQLFLKPTPSSGTPAALVPASYGTRFEELHPESQKMLLQLEERVMDCRAESAALAKMELIVDGDAKHPGHNFKTNAARVRQRLSAVGASISREHASLSKVLLGTHHLLHQAEVAVRSFALLCYRFPQLRLSTPVPGVYTGRPQQELSPYLAQTVDRFELQLSEFEFKLEELERMLLPPTPSAWMDSEGTNGWGGASAAAILPSLLRNLHSFLIHVAAQMEPVHEAVEDAKAAFLAERRRRGDYSDPFQDLARREEQQAMAPQASGLGGGGGGGALGTPAASLAAANLLNQPGTPGMAAPAFLGLSPGFLPTPGATVSGISAPAGTPGVGGGSPFGGPSPFGTGASQPAAPLFGTPQSTTLFGQTPSPFGASSPFGSAQSSPLFGQSPSPSPFGSTSTTPAGGSGFPSFSSAPSSSPFGFSSSPAAAPAVFGSSSPSPFGASASPGLFGTPPSGTPGTLFGSTSSTPAFGASSTFGGGFGGAAASPFGVTPPTISIPGSSGPGTFGFSNSGATLNKTTSKGRAGRRR